MRFAGRLLVRLHLLRAELAEHPPTSSSANTSNSSGVQQAPRAAEQAGQHAQPSSADTSDTGAQPGQQSGAQQGGAQQGEARQDLRSAEQELRGAVALDLTHPVALLRLARLLHRYVSLHS